MNLPAAWDWARGGAGSGPGEAGPGLYRLWGQAGCCQAGKDAACGRLEEQECPCGWCRGSTGDT